MRFVGLGDLAHEQEMLDQLDHLRDFLVFGGDGGGEVYGFTHDGQVVVVPLIGDVEDAIPQGSFTDFMLRCAAGTMFER